MCGIIGCVGGDDSKVQMNLRLRKMLGMIRHRGPDQFGVYIEEGVGLGNSRLSIIDLDTGQQPISNETENIWIVYNGELFNYLPLRSELERKGHLFSTLSDTEVIIHLFEEYGVDCVNKMNGQFAFAIWNAKEKSLFLARDRVGIRPLFYTHVGETFFFASEIKAILVNPEIKAEIDLVAFDQLFTYWSPISPRTFFKNISELPPGSFMVYQEGKSVIKPYWHLENVIPNAPSPSNKRKPYHSLERTGEIVSELKDLLVDSVRIQLQSDVPVGAYLSGGLDSSLTASIIQKYTNNYLDTFSITFEDERYDEGKYQRQMAKIIGTNHHTIHINDKDIGRIFPDVVWHTEVPILRTSPAPMFLLSQFVKQNNYKVVVTGEGADEMFAGYDIFKEAKIRRFWAEYPESTLRPMLLKNLYPYIPGFVNSQNEYLTAFFKQGLTDLDNPTYSHTIRWNSTSHNKRFFKKDVVSQIRQSTTQLDSICIPEGMMRWEPLNRDQFLEITTFLSTYLLSSQGDRMGMAHSVEGRFPFLDHRIIEYAFQLPPVLKMKGLMEKYILKKLGDEFLPHNILYRHKQPYRAPIQNSFIGKDSPAYVEEILSPAFLEEAGMFDANSVGLLIKKSKQISQLREIEEMALVGIISSQLFYLLFIKNFAVKEPISKTDNFKEIIR